LARGGKGAQCAEREDYGGQKGGMFHGDYFLFGAAEFDEEPRRASSS
jgi:hypothetical protein